MEVHSNKAMKITIKGIACIILGMITLITVATQNKTVRTEIAKQIENVETIKNSEENNIQIATQEQNIEVSQRQTSTVTARSATTIRNQEQNIEATEKSEELSTKQAENEEALIIANTDNNQEQTQVIDLTDEVTTEYISIEEVTISKNMDLTQRTGLSKEDFKTLISQVKKDKSKFFYDNSDYIYDLCEKYELNEIFFCGLISAESGWEIASNHRRTYNYISLMSNGKLIQYASLEEGLETAAKKLHNNYLTPGGKFYYGKTLSAVKTKFCPASSTWVDLVYGRMQQIIKSK